jgi:glucosamine-6-phosphate deaminase
MTVNEIMNIPREDLGKNSPIKFEIVEGVHDVYLDMALTMAKEVRKNNKDGKNTGLICPVGPVGYLEIFARLVNDFDISLKSTYIFPMDEYLDDNMQTIPLDHPLSFSNNFYASFYNLLLPENRIPEGNLVFPKPGYENNISDTIDKIGGIDVALGGVGIAGHIAFNEPPSIEDDITDGEFASLPTRVLKLTPETRTINSTTNTRGAIDLIPEYCITIGMREILGARKLRFYMNRVWQCGIVRKVLHGPVTRFVPASFLQRHPDAKLTVCSFVAEMPGGRLM